MGQNKKETWAQLKNLWESNNIDELNLTGHKYLIMSDIHLGNGGEADDFHENEKTLMRALKHYNTNNYKLVLLGDIEEFWQFNVEQVFNRYKNSIYKEIRSFGDDRVFRIFGNHDLEWGCPADPTLENPTTHKCAAEALKMKDDQGNCILLLHGHQGSTESDKYNWFSRFWVRIYTKIEPFIKLDPHTPATKSQVTKDYEQIFYGWAKKYKVIVICGHSHRAIFASKSWAEKIEEKIGKLQSEILLANRDNREAYKRKVNANIKKIQELQKELLTERERGRDIDPAEPNRNAKPHYFNTGCALYTDGITAIEIENDQIRLVKWDKKPVRNQFTKMYGYGTLSEFIQNVRG